MQKNWLTILLISVSTIILWFYVSLNEEYRAEFQTQLKFKNMPAGYGVSYIEPENVKLTLVGKGFNLAKISWGGDDYFDISAENDSGMKRINLKKELEKNIWIAGRGKVLDITPEYVDFFVEKIIKKKVPVIPHTEVSFKESYAPVSSLKLIPDSIWIEGTVSKLDGIHIVNTERISYKNADRTISARLSVVKDENIKYSEESALFTLDIQKIADKTFTDVPVVIEGAPDDKELILFPNRATIKLRGGIKNLGNMSEKDIYISMNFSDAENDTLGILVPEVRVPEYMNLVEMKPASFDYIIKKR